MTKVQSIWQSSEARSGLLSDYTDMENTCQAALQFLLDTLGRSSGVFWVASSSTSQSNHTTDLLVSQNLSDSWSTQLADRSSALHQCLQYILHSKDVVPLASLPEDQHPPDDLAAAVPIVCKSETLGAILIQGTTCSSAEIALLEALILPVGRVIHASRRLGTLQDHARELASLQMELTRLGFNADSDGIQFQMILGANNILDGEACALILLDDVHSEWMIRKSLGGEGEWIYQANPKEGKGLVRECLRSGEIIRSNDVSSDPRFDPSSDGLSGVQVSSLLCSPLLINNQVLGAIQVLNKRQGAFDDYDQDLLSIITVLAANSMHGTRIIQQLELANADLEASRSELLISRNTLRALFDNLPVSLYIIDQDYMLIAINKSRAQRTTKKPQSLVGKLCYKALFDRDKPCEECRAHETIQDGRKTKRNERRWYNGEEMSEWEINTYPILDEDGQVIQIILLEQDSTERRRLEDILSQSEKLAAVGQLAAGVAHEINNPLTAIIANAQILHRELPLDHDLQESVDLIARAGARATHVVRNLLDFARKEEYHLGFTDINETLERALELARHELLARGVQLKFSPASNLPPILASQDHLQSVWLNLLLNAIDALDKSPGEIRVATNRAGDEIHILVADNGKGILPENLTRIFEPFYTTKAPGRGTGLGLSVSHRIVKQHGGHIRVESQVGVGSEFTIVLPLA